MKKILTLFFVVISTHFANASSVFIPEDMDDLSRVYGNFMAFWQDNQTTKNVLLKSMDTSSISEDELKALKKTVDNERKKPTCLGRAVKTDFGQAKKDLVILFDFLEENKDKIELDKSTQFYLSFYNAAVLFERTALSLEAEGLLTNRRKSKR